MFLGLVPPVIYTWPRAFQDGSRDFYKSAAEICTRCLNLASIFDGRSRLLNGLPPLVEHFHHPIALPPIDFLKPYPPLPIDHSNIPPGTPYSTPTYIVCETEDDADDNLLGITPWTFIGFDIEWEGQDPRMSPSAKEALRLEQVKTHRTFVADWDSILICVVQIAVQGRPVIVLDLVKMRAVPKHFRRIVLDKRIFKVGAGIQNDGFRLWRDLCLNLNSAISLSYLAKLAYPHSFRPTDKFCVEPGLDKIVWAITGYTISKNCRRQNWKNRPLEQNLLDYAATDAASALEAFRTLYRTLDTSRVKYRVNYGWCTFHVVNGLAVDVGDSTKCWVAECPWWSEEPGVGFLDAEFGPWCRGVAE
ncbi:ribonuclease H-like domain-containing protein [Roridomyces roridus]|uniref:3'-5' exonuclease n=1 Tax=Roridomyces roridus TaxID=1738132 RepID=A0AAD7C089_9AGAR|nr:ribonuclease H-like domain-containing protein [Roridomyces roridus]